MLAPRAALGLVLLSGVFGASCSLFTDLDGVSGGRPVTDRVLDAAPAGPDGGGGPDGSGGSDGGPSADYGAGDGHDGPGMFATGTHVLNRYATLTEPVVAGQATLLVTAPHDFPAGSLVLVHRTAGAAADTLRSTTFDLSTTDVGTFEIRRVVKQDGAALVVDRPWSRSMPREGAQAIFVPELSEVVIEATARIEPKPWDGSTGGVVVLFAQGAITNDGRISGDATGFRGGAAHLDDNDNCTQLDGAAENGFSFKGEGIVSSAFDPDPSATNAGGRGQVANAGGGGNCGNTGGGGGGNGTAGGSGGRAAHDGAPNGGLGGAFLSDPTYERLLLGGGGGAGHVDHETASGGGRGGGAIFLRAGSYRGSGAVTAHGAHGGTSTMDGAGGGGAGGTVLMEVDGQLACTAKSIAAIGGNGGSAPANHGPGGGGGAGRVRLIAQQIACAPQAASGVAGTQPNTAAGSHFGATPDDPVPGIVELK